MMKEFAKTFVIIADDDPQIGPMLSITLKTWGYETVSVLNKEQLHRQIAIRQPDLVLLDLEFGMHNGIEVLTELLRLMPDLAVVLMTGHGSIDLAVHAIKQGAYDFLEKPPDNVRLRMTLQHALDHQRLNRRVERLKELVEPANGVTRIFGESPALRHMKELVTSIAPTDATVLIQGESGTGKELVARAIHDQSRRASGPFIPLNMATLPRELVESALFGHEKGAFTGADRLRIGSCEAADGGTLFLDEIGEMDLNIQAKLLRFIQEREIQRLGSNQTRVVNVRIVAATHRDLQDLVRRSLFREDLFYRLQVVPIEVPPLRARRCDIALLAIHFLNRSAARHGKEVIGFSANALALMTNYDWPGNIRQLENLVERLVILSRGREIDSVDLPAEFHAATQIVATSFLNTKPTAVDSFEEVEKRTILEALRNSQGNVRAAAKLLGLGQATIYRKMKLYGVGSRKVPAQVIEETATIFAS